MAGPASAQLRVLDALQSEQNAQLKEQRAKLLPGATAGGDSDRAHM